MLKPKQRNLYSEFVKYTPKMAKELLGKAKTHKFKSCQLHNRRVTLRLVEKYALSMMEQKWQHRNGENVKFTPNMILLDGQHRLLAIILNDRAQVLYTTFNVPEECFVTMDTGRGRNGSDTLTCRGAKNANHLSGALILMTKILNKEVQTKRPVSNQDVDDLYFEHSGMGESVRLADRARPRMRGFCSVSRWAALHYLFSRSDPDMATQFFEEVGSGEGLASTSPAYALRNKFIGEMGVVAKHPSPVRVAWIIKAWNKYRIKKRMKVVSWNPKKEAFPSIEPVTASE